MVRKKININIEVRSEQLCAVVEIHANDKRIGPAERPLPSLFVHATFAAYLGPGIGFPSSLGLNSDH